MTLLLQPRYVRAVFDEYNYQTHVLDATCATALFTDTVPLNTFLQVGDKIELSYSGVFSGATNFQQGDRCIFIFTAFNDASVFSEIINFPFFPFAPLSYSSSWNVRISLVLYQSLYYANGFAYTATRSISNLYSYSSPPVGDFYVNTSVIGSSSPYLLKFDQPITFQLDVRVVRDVGVCIPGLVVATQMATGIFYPAAHS